MKTIPKLAFPAAAMMLVGFAQIAGCEKKPEARSTSAPAPAGTGKDAHGHGHDDDHAGGAGHGHGPTTQLGEVTVEGFTVKASRDGGLTPGGDTPVAVWVTGGSSKVNAVRFWIGTQDAKGSMKAKAELETDSWHTHVEVPKPMPTDSKLWVEIDAEGSEKILASFELNG